MKFQAKISYMETHCTLNTQIQRVLEQTSSAGILKHKLKPSPKWEMGCIITFKIEVYLKTHTQYTQEAPKLLMK